MLLIRDFFSNWDFLAKYSFVKLSNIGFDGMVVENSPFPPAAYVRIPDMKFTSLSIFYPLPIDDIIGSPGSILDTGIIFFLICEGLGGSAAPCFACY
jgi:hypothetical protein